jgi:hypothetical protein
MNIIVRYSEEKERSLRKRRKKRKKGKRREKKEKEGKKEKRKEGRKESRKEKTKRTTATTRSRSVSVWMLALEELDNFRNDHLTLFLELEGSWLLVVGSGEKFFDACTRQHPGVVAIAVVRFRLVIDVLQKVINYVCLMGWISERCLKKRRFGENLLQGLVGQSVGMIVGQRSRRRGRRRSGGGGGGW